MFKKNKKDNKEAIKLKNAVEFVDDVARVTTHVEITDMKHETKTIKLFLNNLKNHNRTQVHLTLTRLEAQRIATELMLADSKLSEDPNKVIIEVGEMSLKLCKERQVEDFMSVQK